MKILNTYNGQSVWLDTKGYPTIWVNGKSIKLHIFVWEQKNGKKPKGYDIHHKDFNKENFDIDNLILLSKHDHRKIHAGWQKNENGDWLKPCKDCKRLLSLDKFYQRKGLTPSNRCIECSLKYFKEVGKSADFKARRKKYMKKYYEEHKEKWQN